MNNRQLGSKYESIAADYLVNLGMYIIRMNHRTREGEIDIIASDKNYLVFVEVKYRSSSRKGYALEAIDAKKQSRLRKLALSYISSNYPGQYVPVRFDCIGITGNSLRYVRNAF